MNAKWTSPISVALALLGLAACGGGGGGDTSALPAGTLDPTFGSGGKVTTAIGAGTDEAHAIAIAPDGKIVAAGTSHNGTNYDFALARYNPDGTLDTSFGSGGKVVTAIGAGDDFARALALAPDGKTVVAGVSLIGTTFDFALARYNTDGTLDTTFGSGGKVTTAIGPSYDSAYAVALATDGRIVVAGYSDAGSTNYDFALVRYNTDGTLDTTFGSGGKVVTAIGGTDEAHALVLVPDGRIVVAGTAWSITGRFVALARYNTDGTLDTSFGNGGKVVTAVGGINSSANAVALAPTGRIVVAGFGHNGTNYDFALARYNPDGTLDTSFGSGGKVTTPIGSSDDEAYALALAADGKIVVAGRSTNGTDDDLALARYNPDGTLDTSFGSGGKVVTEIGSDDDKAYAIALAPDGRIVVAGMSYNGTNFDFALTRYNY